MTRPDMNTIGTSTGRLFFSAAAIAALGLVSGCSGREAVPVDKVFGKGGVWRVEGTLPGSERVVEPDLDASLTAPAPGTTVFVRSRRSETFPQTGAQP